MKSRVVGFIVLGVVVAIGAGVGYQAVTDDRVLTEQANAASTNLSRVAGGAGAPARSVVALGRLEPADGSIEVSNILVGDRLVELVEEGTHVVQHERLGRLDPTFRQTDVDLAAARHAEAKLHLDAERTTAQAQLNNATLALQQAIEGATTEVEAQRKQVKLLTIELEQVGTDLTRLENLSQSSNSIVSAQELEHQRLRRDKTSAEKEAAEATLRHLQQAAKFNSETAQAKVHSAEVALAAVDKRSTVNSLEVQRRNAEERLARTEVIAPISGTVLRIYTRVGESVAEQPILQMADLSRFDCVAEVFESDINRVTIGSTAHIRSRAFRGNFNDTYVVGRVKRIGNAMPTRELKPLSPLEPIDKHVIQVEIDLSGKTEELVNHLGEGDATDVQDRAQALVNLQVEVTFPAPSENTASGSE